MIHDQEPDKIEFGYDHEKRYCDYCDRFTMTPSHTMCAMHYKRRQRGGDMWAPPRKRCDSIDKFQSLFDRVLDAGMRLVDCDSEDDSAWDRARQHFRECCIDYASGEIRSTRGKVKGK